MTGNEEFVEHPEKLSKQLQYQDCVKNLVASGINPSQIHGGNSVNLLDAKSNSIDQAKTDGEDTIKSWKFEVILAVFIVFLLVNIVIISIVCFRKLKAQREAQDIIKDIKDGRRDSQNGAKG